MRQHFRVRYVPSAGRQESWYVCDRGTRQSRRAELPIDRGPPIDEAIGGWWPKRMTPAAVELALDIRREIEARQEEADQLRCRAIERAQIEADLAQRRFMMVDPNNRLVADTLEAEWNDKLRALAQAREEREQARQQDQLVLDDAIRQRLLAMTTDFKQLWADPDTPNRERKRLLAHIIEDATLIKLPGEGITKIHVRFKGGKTETLTTLNPKSSAQQVRTPPEIMELVDKLLDNHIYSEIADILNQQGLRPGGSARPGRSSDRFTALRVAYLIHRYSLPSRYDRLRDRGMLNSGSCGSPRHPRSDGCPLGGTWHRDKTRLQCARVPLRVAGFELPAKHSSRWHRLSDRALSLQNSARIKTFRSNRKRCSVKPVSWHRPKARFRPRRGPSADCAGRCRTRTGARSEAHTTIDPEPDRTALRTPCACR